MQNGDRAWLVVPLHRIVAVASRESTAAVCIAFFKCFLQAQTSGVRNAPKNITHVRCRRCTVVASRTMGLGNVRHGWKLVQIQRVGFERRGIAYAGRYSRSKRGLTSQHIC